MPTESVFALDASFFIEAKQGYLAFDIAPKFWELLLELAVAGRVESIDQIYKEIGRGRDALAIWAGGDFREHFATCDNSKVIDHYRKIMQWVGAQERFKPSEVVRFAKGADGWLIAYAMVKGRVVVTNERPDPSSPKVKIPDVCKAFEVAYSNPFAMIRDLGIMWA